MRAANSCSNKQPINKIPPEVCKRPQALLTDYYDGASTHSHALTLLITTPTQAIEFVIRMNLVIYIHIWCTRVNVCMSIPYTT